MTEKALPVIIVTVCSACMRLTANKHYTLQEVEGTQLQNTVYQ